MEIETDLRGVVAEPHRIVAVEGILRVWDSAAATWQTH
jgi:hypothetical protein